jgi:P27 family predicted phage terminase small subunit
MRRASAEAQRGAKPEMARASEIQTPDRDRNSESTDIGSGAAPVEEPTSVAPIIECPPELGAAARQEWDRIVADITATGVVCTLDRAALAVYCQAYSIWSEAVENLKRFGTVIKSPSGYPVQSPYLSIANQQVDIMLRIAAQFGFTPASRGQKVRFPRGDTELLDGDEDSSELKDLGDMAALPKLKW